MHLHAKDAQVALLVTQEETVEGFLVGEGSDGVGGELKRSVVFGLFQENYLHVPVVKASDYHDVVINYSNRHIGG